MNLILFIFIILYWYFLKNHNEKTVNTYNIVVGIVVFLIIGLRNEAIYGDTLSYCANFLDMLTYDADYIPVRFPKDPTFYLLSYYLSEFVNGQYVYWLLIISAIYIAPLTIIIRKYSLNPMYSWTSFIFIGLYFFVMAGLRQTVAMGFILIAFLMLMNKRDILFFLFVGIAYLFHVSSLIFVIVYPLFKFKVRFNIISIVCYLILAGILAVAGEPIMKDTIEVMAEQDQRYETYGENLNGATITYFLQQFIIVVPSLILLRRSLSNRLYALLTHIALLGLSIALLSPVVAEMFRLSMYFSWAGIILFAAAMTRARTPLISLGYLLFFFVYLTFINGSLQNEYLFWFEDNNNFIMNHYEFIA